MVAPRRRPALTPESWDALFNFLDPTRPDKQGPNRDADAEDRFQDIERKLVYFFAGRAFAGGMVETFGDHWSEPDHQQRIVEKMQLAAHGSAK